MCRGGSRQRRDVDPRTVSALACPGPVREPYSRSADVFDHVFSRAMLPWLVRSFRRLVRRHAIRVRSAADVGCGSGRFVRFLADLGVRVFGVDRSPAMIRLARMHNRGNGSVFLLQDMRRLRLPRPVDLITCNFDALNYLPALRDLEQTLRGFAANLRDGGHVIFDVIVDDPRPRRAVYRRFDLGTDRRRSTWHVLEEPSRGLRRAVLVHRGVDAAGRPRHEHEVHRQRAFALADVVRALRASGLAPLSIHAPSSGAEPRVVIAARKHREPERSRHRGDPARRDWR